MRSLAKAAWKLILIPVGYLLLSVVVSILADRLAPHLDKRGATGAFADAVTFLRTLQETHPTLFLSLFWIAIAMAGLLILVALLEHKRTQQEEQEQFARFFDICKPVQDVTPQEDIPIEQYNPYYLPRGEVEEAIRQLLAGGRYPLVTGAPMMGKSRSAWEAVKEKKGWYLVMPGIQDIPLHEVPLTWVKDKRVLLFIDDLQKFAGLPFLSSLLARLRERAREFACIATCRTGYEYRDVERMGFPISGCFEEVELGDLSDHEGEEICRELGLDWEERRHEFDRTPGSLLLGLEEMRRRYEYRLSEDARNFLRALKLLYLCGIYRYRLALVREAARSIFGLDVGRPKEIEVLRDLADEARFIRARGDAIQVEDPYLEQCVTDYPHDDSTFAEDKQKLVDLLSGLRDAENLFSMGSRAYIASSLELAEKCLSSCLAIMPDYGLAHNNYANVLSALGRKDEAGSHYEEALRLWPGDFVARTNYAGHLRQLGRRDEALEQLRRVVDLKPDDFLAHYGYAVLLSELSRPEDAEVHYRESIRLRGDFPFAHRGLARVLCNLGRRGQAKSCYEEALKLDPSDAEAHINYGILLVGLDCPDDAEKHLREAVRLRPDLPKAHYNYAVLLDILDRLNEAEMHYRDALRLCPSFTQAHHFYGTMLWRINRIAEAADHYAEVVRAKPDDNAIHCNYAILLTQLGRRNEAESHFRRALELRSDDAYTHVNLGNLLSGLGRHDEAEAHYVEATKHDPTNARINFVYGTYLRRTNRRKEAEFQLRKAVSADPSFALAHYQLGLLLQETNRGEEAQRHFDEANRLQVDLQKSAGVELQRPSPPPVWITTRDLEQ